MKRWGRGDHHCEGYVFTRVCLSTGGGEGGGIPACLAGLRGGVIPACLAGFQAHTQGGGGGGELDMSGGESPGPHPGGRLRGLARGVSRPTPGGCIPACTEADPYHLMATAAGGMPPTGMHSFLFLENFHEGAKQISTF